MHEYSHHLFHYNIYKQIDRQSERNSENNNNDNDKSFMTHSIFFHLCYVWYGLHATNSKQTIFSSNMQCCKQKAMNVKSFVYICAKTKKVWHCCKLSLYFHYSSLIYFSFLFTLFCIYNVLFFCTVQGYDNNNDKNIDISCVFSHPLFSFTNYNKIDFRFVEDVFQQNIIMSSNDFMDNFPFFTIYTELSYYFVWNNL